MAPFLIVIEQYPFLADDLTQDLDRAALEVSRWNEKTPAFKPGSRRKIFGTAVCWDYLRTN